MASTPPPGIDLTEDNTANVVGPVVAVTALAIISVVLRVWSRSLSQLPFQWDDWLILLSLGLTCTLGGINVAFTHYGIGKHIWSPEVNLKMVLKLLLVTEYVYTFAIPSVKMAVIMFYHRIFSVHRFDWALYFCTFLVLGWWVGVLVTVSVQCRPYQHLWNQYLDPTAEGTCINLYSFFLGNGIAEAVTDFVILAVPIPMVWQLHMPVTQKFAVLGIFLLGSFVCVAGVMRVHATTYFIRDDDLTWNLSHSMMWTSVEPAIGVVSACLPTLRPLMSRTFPNLFNRSTRAASNPKYVGQSTNRSNKTGEFYRLQENSKFRSQGDDGVGLTNDVAISGGSSGRPGEDHSPYSISVQRDILWTSKHVDK